MVCARGHSFLHICLQPYFTHVINCAVTRSENARTKYVVIKRLCLIGGAMLFARFLFADMHSTFDASKGLSTEWLRGEKLCTFR